MGNATKRDGSYASVTSNDTGYDGQITGRAVSFGTRLVPERRDVIRARRHLLIGKYSKITRPPRSISKEEMGKERENGNEEETGKEREEEGRGAEKRIQRDRGHYNVYSDIDSTFRRERKKMRASQKKGGKASARALYPLDIGDCVFCQGSKVPRLPTPVRFDV